MPQIHCYLPEDLAERLHQKAREAHLPVSRYVAQVIRKDVEDQWPEGWFDLFGTWQGEPIERPPQGEFERRTDIG